MYDIWIKKGQLWECYAQSMEGVFVWVSKLRKKGEIK